MLHRLALRVLPSLSLAVTEAQVRTRKRLVKLVPGLAAFAVYRVVKLFDPVSDPLTLLALSGLLSAVTAVCAYRVGRQAPFLTVLKEDGPRRVAWVVGWVGFAYGVQLSLLILALLRVLVNYDFLLHPDGPAMMAIIIASMSVARDAFEIGHVRSLEQRKEPVLTFPDGAPLRALLVRQPGQAGLWFALGAIGCALGAFTVATLGETGRSELGQLLAVTIFGGSLALVAYLAGQQPTQWWSKFRETSWPELSRFWWWPGLTFAATYYFALLGAVVFVLKVELPGGLVQALMAGTVGGLLALYCYYLGFRRSVEDRVRQVVPDSLLRCPFVMGILSKGKGIHDHGAGPPAAVAAGRSGRRG